MKCKYCGEKAGFLTFAHKECKERHNVSIKSIHDCLKSHFDNKNGNYDTIHTELQTTCVNGYVKEKEFEEIVCQYVNQCLQSEFRPYDYLESFIMSMPKEYANKIHNDLAYSNYWKSIVCEIFNDNNKALGIFNEEEKATVPIASKDQIEIIEKIKNNGSKEINDFLEQNMVDYVGRVIDFALEDDLIDENEENCIFQLIKDFDLFGKEILKERSFYRRLIQALVLRDLKENKPIERVAFEGFPVILGKNEFPVWGYNGIKGYEKKTKRTYEGGSRGVNVRICKGVYYKAGASKGYPVDRQYQSPLGNGCFLISNKNIFFVGNKSIKIPINKIISYTEYSDGIELVKDGANPKPYTFVGCDSWFIINAIQLLA